MDETNNPEKNEKYKPKNNEKCISNKFFSLWSHMGERSLSSLLSYLLAPLSFSWSHIFYALRSIYALFSNIFIYDFVNQHHCDRSKSHLANYTYLISCIIITTAVMHINRNLENYCSYLHLGKNKKLFLVVQKHPMAFVFIFGSTFWS